MAKMVAVRAIVRIEMLDRVVRCLKEVGVPRLTVTRVHAIGAGVDPKFERFSFDEGSAYADKAQVEFICEATRYPELVELVAQAARTGRHGDGIVSVQPVDGVTKVRTGVRGVEALR